MLSLPVCPVDVCPFARKISRLDGAVGWLSHQLCGRQDFDPPCPVTKQQAMVLERAYGCIEDLPVISYAGTAVLTAAPARRLRFVRCCLFSNSCRTLTWLMATSNRALPVVE